MARRVFESTVAALAVVMIGGAARANPVNAEALRPKGFGEGWSGGLDLSFALSRGNIDLLDLGGGARVQFQTLHEARPGAADEEGAPPFVRQRVFLTGSGRFAEREGVTFISQAFSHLRWTAMWHRRIGTDAFAQLQMNEFQLLELRGLVGLGARFEIVHERDVLVWAGTGVMLEAERIDVQDGASDTPESLATRSTSYLSARLELFEGALLVQNTLYVQPRLDAPSDVRVLDELELQSRVNDVITLGLTLSVLHDSEPPTGVERTDLRLAHTIRLSF